MLNDSKGWIAIEKESETPYMDRLRALLDRLHRREERWFSAPGNPARTLHDPTQPCTLDAVAVLRALRTRAARR